MSCTTILVGNKASYDGSTMIARNDDSPSGVFTAKKMVVVKRNKMPKIYKTKISKATIELPETSLRCTMMPNVDNSEGVWAASGINEKDVAMSATETITSNARVLGADPLVLPKKDSLGRIKKAGGIGEEDFVYIVLPYINSAKEGVIRLGELLEKYGTYESNGIAFSDKENIWWLETIGGHHWIARRVKDEEYVVMPNQFGLDRFDFNDAFGEQKENMCSKDLKEFILNNHLDLNLDENMNPRVIFGSHDDSDHTYNTPRAWFMERYLNPKTFKWDGEDADYNPESDDIPWSNVPEKKITVEDVKYLLSSHYQGTKYDPYAKNNPKDFKPLYRPIGISRTSFMSIAQIRPYIEGANASLEWVCFGSNMYNTMIPLYINVNKIPSYLRNTTLNVSTNNFYWASRLIGALSDPHYQTSIVHVERYQEDAQALSHELINKFDDLYIKENSEKTLEKANDEIASNIKKLTDKALNNVLYDSSCHMKNGFSRSDN